MSKPNYEKFWMCVVEGRPYPRVAHITYEDALKEAKRLAQKENKSVFILETTEIVACVPNFEVATL